MECDLPDAWGIHVARGSNGEKSNTVSSGEPDIISPESLGRPSSGAPVARAVGALVRLDTAPVLGSGGEAIRAWVSGLLTRDAEEGLRMPPGERKTHPLSFPPS